MGDMADYTNECGENCEEYIENLKFRYTNNGNLSDEELAEYLEAMSTHPRFVYKRFRYRGRTGLFDE